VLRAPSEKTQSQVDAAIDLAVTIGVGILILVGFATSYRTLLDLAVTAGGYPRWLAPAVPLSFDLGIVVLSLKVAQSAREGRRAPVLRFLVTGLSALTVLANASAVDGVPGRVLHAVPPAMFVVCFESVIITARRRALEARGAWPEPIPRQHPLRWMLAPCQTWRRWTSSVLESGVGDTGARLPDRDAATQPGITGGPRELPPIDVPARDDRHELAISALRDRPTMSAHDLLIVLRTAGHVVSLRTAQRIRAHAAKELENSRGR
jgi:hypothetical protein